jgi:amino acid permease
MCKKAIRKSFLTISPSAKLAKILAVFVFFLFSTVCSAQCAMCRAALGGEANKEQAQAVNDGIVYLMIIPYVLVAAIGYAVYRMRKNKVK